MNIIKEKKEVIWQLIVAAGIFTYGLMYPALEYTFYSTFALILTIIALAGMLIYKHVDLDLKMLLLFQVFLFVGFSNSRNWIEYEVPFTWMLFWPYVIGKLAVGNKKKDVNKYFTLHFFTMAAGMTLSGMLDILYGVITDQYTTEYTFNFWTGDYYARTTHEYNYLFIIATFLFALVKGRKNKRFYLINLLDLIIVVDMIYHQGRYSLTYTLLQIMAFFLLYVIEMWFAGGKKRKVIEGIVITLIAIIVIGLIAFRLDFLGLYTKYENSYLVGGGSVFHNQRYDFLVSVIGAIPDHMLGGYDIASPEGSHNMWLEYGDKYGVLILVLLLLFKLLTFKDAIIVAIKEKSDIRYLILSAFVYLQLYYTLEPNGFARRELFIFGLFFWGLIRGKVEVENKGDIELTKFNGESKYVAD